MKIKIIALAVLVLFASLHLAAIDSKALKGLRKKDTKIEGVTWTKYSSKKTAKNNFRKLRANFDYDNSMFYLYIIVKEGKEAFLHMHVQAEPLENWIKFNKVTIIANGNTFEKEFDVKQLNATLAQGNQFIESYSAEVMEHEIKMFETIAEAKDVTIRYQGAAGKHEYKMNKNDRKAVKQILKAWKKINKK